MRSLATFCLAVLMIASLSPALASESETIKAINESSNALDKAFEKNDKAAIKALMTPDHISVTPYYAGAADHRRSDRVPARAQMGPEDRGRRESVPAWG
jgi:hypothetical protein